MISRTEFENFNKKFDVVSVFIDQKGKTLLLHRQDHKPQGNTWAMVAGKVDFDEEMLPALIREVKEEIGLVTSPEDYKYFEGYFVRYPAYDYMYHVYHLPLKDKPVLNMNSEEHKDLKWITPTEALNLNLIEDEDQCIKWFYEI